MLCSGRGRAREKEFELGSRHFSMLRTRESTAPDGEIEQSATTVSVDGEPRRPNVVA